MLKLKHYQKECLDVLKEYLEEASIFGAQDAFARVVKKHPSDIRQTGYRVRWELENVPYVCLRLPTGGGKTLLAAHSVGLAAQYFLNREKPLVLWLVPTNTIRKQTVQALKQASHPYREALNAAFGVQGVSVFDVEDINAIRSEDLFKTACIIVATMQTFRVADSNKDARKIYGENENFEQHFRLLPNTDPALDKSESGEVLHSFVNLVHQLCPLMIVDEAHKMISQLSGEVVRRINPSCVLEFTATPVESNVLFRVFPSRLKEEEMIKLPFNVVEHANWEEAVLQAVETRNRLAQLAVQDTDYIRPLVLFQAEKKNQSCTVETLKQFLLEQNIPKEHIAVATGDQRELDTIDVFSPDCPVRYVITVEALKEGWDCSFAYVFCSVANIRSATDVEQLLGRVMRMPYARARSNTKLNMAYAHVIANSFRDAAEAMYDRMIDMGFGEDEAAAQVQKPPMLPGATDDFLHRRFPPALEEVAQLTIALPQKPDLASLAEAGKGIQVRETEKGVEIVSTGMISREAEEAIVACAPAKQRDEVRKKIALHRRNVAQHMPRPLAKLGEIFAVPQLLLDVDGELEVVEPELLCGEWSPLDFLQAGECPLQPGEFCYDRATHAFRFDLQGEKLVWHSVDAPVQPMLYAPDVEENMLTLSRKLDRLCRVDDIAQPVMLEFCRRCVQGLVERDGNDVTTLFVARRILAQCICRKIAHFRILARKRGFQQLLASPGVRVETREGLGFSFPLEGYAESIQTYAGAYQFRKHYYGLPRDLKASGEEFRCAQAIDMHPAVKTWVRNVDRQGGSFWLPTSTDRFYPDFVVWLNDGRILLVEYKGKHLLSSDDTREKRNIGALWAEKSNGVGAFMLVCEADSSLSFAGQLAALVPNA